LIDIETEISDDRAPMWLGKTRQHTLVRCTRFLNFVCDLQMIGGWMGC